jgi:hypothetical protein
MKAARILNRDGKLPDDGWFQIEVTGEHPVVDGRVQVIDDKAITSIVNRFAEEKEKAGENWAGLLVDADHLSHDLDKTTAALGWLVDVQNRDGQLFGKLDLTDLGEPAVKNKRFKFFSTEYAAADLENLGDGRVRPLRLAGLAFTNRPNNRGGKPISNRKENPGGEPTEHDTNQKMKPIAEALGLSADADEAAILNAITGLQSKVQAAEAKETEAKAEEILNTEGKHIPQSARESWKQQLIANRNNEATVTLIKNSFPEPAKEKEGEEKIFNRDKAKSPAPVEGQNQGKDGEAEKKAAAIRNRANTIALEQSIPFGRAFDLATAELS